MSALGSSVTPVAVPPELTNLRDLSQLPIALGVFLAVLGFAALSYVLVVTGRSRRAEFAVYKALGLDEKMSRRIVYFQASVIAIVGLIIGVPLGVIAGRWGWSAVTARVPLEMCIRDSGVPASPTWWGRPCCPCHQVVVP